MDKELREKIYKKLEEAGVEIEDQPTEDHLIVIVNAVCDFILDKAHDVRT